MKRFTFSTIALITALILALGACGGEKVISEIEVVATPTTGPTPTPFVIIVTPTPTPRPGPLSVVEAYVRAINAGDIAAAAAMYSDDIVVETSALTRLEAHSKVRLKMGR